MTAKAERFDDRTWTEIALFGALIAFIWWLLYHMSHPAAPGQQAPSISLPGMAPASHSVPSIGLPPLVLPHSGCGCHSCAAGTVSPGIADIVANTNAALAAIQAGGIQTVRTLAAIGNSAGLANFVVQ